MPGSISLCAHTKAHMPDLLTFVNFGVVGKSTFVNFWVLGLDGMIKS